ncbi:SLC13 family permease [Treponema sp.]|uniref:SLC13 family permease n=1 Tax=Treponema sp. TaxID=166 RepID=UPI00388E17C2
MENFAVKIKNLFKKDIMLSVSLVAAIISLFITPPSKELLHDINWRTLATLFMLLSVLEGFKSENIFEPLLKMTGKFSSLKSLTVFFVFCVFFSSMFVTNDVSLIIFVPLTIIMFRKAGQEKFILPVLTFENIAAIRGSLLMPFGSPQNLFLYAQSGISTPDFILMMLPLWIFSAFLLLVFISVLYGRKIHRCTQINTDYMYSNCEADSLGEAACKTNKSDCSSTEKTHRGRKIMYITLFVIVVASIVTRTQFYPAVLALVFITLLIGDRKILIKTDYVLLLTFLCFFTFSSSICRHPAISVFLEKSVAGHEYLWSILLSQIISNVPASIVLYPFSTDLRALLYGLDSAGLCSIIGSLASVINLRLYIREYPGKAFAFIKTFTWISLAFFAVVVLPQLWLIIHHQNI